MPMITTYITRMKETVFSLFIFFLSVCCFTQSCQSEIKEEAPLTALETAQQFLRLEMKGEFTKAEDNLLATEYNKSILSAHKNKYDAMSESMKKQIHSEIINIISYDENSDSTAVLEYTNGLGASTQKLQLIRKHKKWLIDFENRK